MIADINYKVTKLTCKTLVFQITNIVINPENENRIERKQDKFRRVWSQHKNTCKYESGTGPGVRRSKRPLLEYRIRCNCSIETS